MPDMLVTRLLRGLIAFVLISALYGLASCIALVSFVVWAIGPGPSSRAGTDGLFWLLVIVLALGFMVCQIVGLKVATRKR
jgi:hypothetical protein